MQSNFVLAELYYSLLKDYGKEKADKYYDKYANSSIRSGPEIIKEAMIFRYENRKRSLYSQIAFHISRQSIWA